MLPKIIELLSDTDEIIKKFARDLSREPNDFGDYRFDFNKSIDTINLIKKGRRELLKAIANKELRCIVLANNENTFKEETFVNAITLHNSIPFKTTLFLFSTPFICDTQFSDNSGAVHIGTNYVCLHELSPEKYLYLSGQYVYTDHRQQLIDRYVIDLIDYDTATQLFEKQINQNSFFLDCPSSLFLIIQTYLNKANKSEYYKLDYHSSNKIQYRNFANRLTGKTFYVNELIYIGNKRKLKETNYEKYKIIAHPDFAYEVMGHWRKLAEDSWIGHDREGNEIKKFTWVKTHIRGNGDLLIKTRIAEN